MRKQLDLEQYMILVTNNRVEKGPLSLQIQKNRSIPIVVRIPFCSTSPTRSAICAIFTVPTTEYRKATVVTKSMEENKLINTYLIDSRS